MGGVDTSSSRASLSVGDLQRVLRILEQVSGHLSPRTLHEPIVDAVPRELGAFHLVNLATVFPATGRLVTLVLPACAWIADGEAKTEVVALPEQGRIGFHAAVAEAIVEEIAESSLAVWENALSKARRGERVEAVVSWRGRTPRAGHIRLFPLSADGRRVLVLA